MTRRSRRKTIMEEGRCQTGGRRVWYQAGGHQAKGRRGNAWVGGGGAGNGKVPGRERVLRRGGTREDRARRAGGNLAVMEEVRDRGQEEEVPG